MLENIIWAWRILWAKAYVVATEKKATLHIGIRDPHTFESILMLSAQYTSLMGFRNRLDEALKEHENIAKQLYGTDLKDPKPKKKVTKKRG